MLQWFHSSPLPAQLTHTVPFQQERLEVFPKALSCRVTHPISALSKGRVTLDGCSWKAELDEQDCQLTLLPDQPAFAIGRRGLVLIVVPYRCLI